MSKGSSFRGYMVLAALAVVVILFISSLMSSDQENVAVSPAEPEAVATETVEADEAPVSHQPAEPYIWQGDM